LQETHQLPEGDGHGVVRIERGREDSTVGGKAQARKDEIVTALTTARRKILDAAHALPPEKQDEVFLGVWSVKDLLAHLIGWDYTNMEAVKSILEGELPEFYAHQDRDWQSYNSMLVERHKREDFAELLYAVEASQRALMIFLEAVPAEEFDKDHAVRFKRYKVTIAHLLEAEAEDEEEHYKQIKEFAEATNTRSNGAP
jgi:uncharacterized damage-inducible protein DinB